MRTQHRWYEYRKANSSIQLNVCTCVSGVSLIILTLYQEFFSKKTDCSLFLFGSHNKKRPNNLIFGKFSLSCKHKYTSWYWISVSVTNQMQVIFSKPLAYTLFWTAGQMILCVCHYFLCCGLFPGRLFDFHVLDMIELGIEKYVSLSEIKVMLVCAEGFVL